MKVNKLKKYIRRVNSPVFQNMKESYKEKVNNLIASFNVTKETVAKYSHASLEFTRAAAWRCRGTIEAIMHTPAWVRTE